MTSISLEVSGGEIILAPQDILIHIAFCTDISLTCNVIAKNVRKLCHKIPQALAGLGVAHFVSGKLGV